MTTYMPSAKKEHIDIEFVNAEGRYVRSSGDKDEDPGITAMLQVTGVTGKFIAGKLNVIMEDVLHANLTVRENLDYAACLRMRPGTPASWRSAVVYAILNDLDLFHRENRVVGPEQSPAISGGERRRVNIGMGIVALPPVLFLDEPTTGLDSSMSRQVVHLVRCLAQMMTINMVAVVHQPSQAVFELFDTLMLLTNEKMVAYQGPPGAAAAYFEQLGYGVGSVREHISHAEPLLDFMTKGDSTLVKVKPSDLGAAWQVHGSQWLRGIASGALKEELE
ncbi:hypothetical protein GPECTOR_206g392 [Gonium pectorale]|uniref:ABC transporter domain-containing protein n=1 Tax=Gonium pectorale TaxID=33097 RepID=A0A150FWX1_GONPE|nr:hypothetical protein GPECTOR_206g392 [Gonium pectorale]|eukprot:KXZ42099.1 hypothetical protein GPECTOR_206g392 [Gonium pectorale]